MRGVVWLVIGVAIGAGGMYLGLRPPWSSGASAPSDAGVAVAPVDAGAGKPTKKKHHNGGGHAGGGGGHAGGGSGGSDSGDTGDSDEPAPATVALTPADRALEWRGDDVSPPKQTIDMGAGGANARALDDGEIQAGISAGAGAVRDCVVSAATGTDLHGAITVKLVVDGTGRVIRSAIQAPHYMQDHGLPACAHRAAAAIHFAATGAPTVVTLPIDLG